MTWVEILSFVIPGPPEPKARPRFGQGRVYTDKKTKHRENVVAFFAQSDASQRWKGTLAPKGVPVRVDILHTFEGKGDESEPHVNRPDVDNLNKLILDGLSKVPRLWHDDAQVSIIRAEKTKAPKGAKPSTFVRIYVWRKTKPRATR